MGTLLAAGVVSILAPPIVARVWRVHFGLLSVAFVLRTALSAGFWTAIAGWSAGAVLRLSGAIAPGLVGPAAGGLALVAGLAGMAARAWVDRGPRAAMALVLRLRDAEGREETLAALRALLDRLARGRSGEAHARALLLAGPALSALGLDAEVEARLAEVPPHALSARTRARWAQATAAVRWRLGDEEGTRRAVALAPRPAADPPVEAWLVAFDALVCVVEGDAAAALALLGPEEGDGDARRPLGVARRIARAHALAAGGRSADARRLLNEVWRVAGREGLALARRPAGPASPLAEALGEAG